ncbi:MAG: PD-(D/E)XK nuclease family protein, partial [Parabacteroides sp.]
YQQYRAEISRLVFVFPNRRAGLFFQKYLSELSDKPLFSPSILTINDLFFQLSGKQTVDRISALFTLYHVYQQVSGSTEHFDEFLYWGEMLLGDFDDVDKYMVDAERLFTNVTDLRSIGDEADYLTEEQIRAIRSFWSSFHPKSDSDGQKQFLALWEILYPLYRNFQMALAAEGKGYEGMIFRDVVERLRQDEGMEFPFEKVIFVGLNALSVVETALLTELQKRGVADFYWDYASDKLTDTDNRASYFARMNLDRFPSSWSLPAESLEQPEVEVIGVSSGIGQAKQVYELLHAETWQPEQALRTAVVLPDERLLVPLLTSLPESICRVNVTMGYPLASTPVATLIEYMLALQQHIRYVEGHHQFSYRDVLPILNHQYVYRTAPKQIAALIAEITVNNRIWIPLETVACTPLLMKLFVCCQEVERFVDYLLEVLVELNRSLEETLEEDGEIEDETALSVSPTAVEQEFIFHYFATVNRMKEVMRDSQVEMRLDTYFRLLKRMAETVTIPFQGEPLSGLQVMGVLETRALDFERVIILSMNDGIFPMKKAANSFIPYNLRRGFGLPTYEHQDSVWAYHFYRLISRASRVSLLYDTRSTGLQTGEVSRFVHQLRYHYEFPVRQKWVVYDVSSSKSPEWSVPKRPDVMARLQAFLKSGKRALSASAINCYLDCPLKFYFAVLEDMREEETVNETIENDLFGSILHKVMEILYKPLCGKQVTADLLRKIMAGEQELTEAIAQAFACEYFKSETVRPLIGQNYLIGEMIRHYVKKVLERDCQLTPFRYVQSERIIWASVPIQDGEQQVQLKGFIDRLDLVQDTLRIVDYKSGKKTTVFNQLEDLFDRECPDRPAAIFQVFLYAWMCRQSAELKQTEIRPALYCMRSLFDSAFNPAIMRRLDRSRTESVERFSDYAADFERLLTQCLEEIFSPDIPFTQSCNGEACLFCSFKQICGK